jgi:hypothetical protein
MIKIISKNDLFKEKERFESEIIKKVNAELKGCFYNLIDGKAVAIDMADLNILKSSSEMIISYFNETKEWQANILVDKSISTKCDVLTFKLL